MSEIITRRNGKIIEFGNSLGLTLREELLDLGLDVGKDVQITVTENAQKKKITIEKI